jgi:type II secretory pathway predicted ATPase ExeA
MTPAQLEALIRYRIDQAYETLREAELLFDQSAILAIEVYLRAQGYLYSGGKT